MGIQAERVRRTTHRLAAHERKFCECKAFLAGLPQIRRAEVAAWLLARLGVELEDEPDGHEASTFTRLAYETLEAQKQLLHRTVPGYFTTPEKQ